MVEQKTKELEHGKHRQKPRLWERMKRRMKLAAARTLLVTGISGLAIGMAIPAGAKADGFSFSAYPGYTYNVQNDSHGPSLRFTGGGELTGGVMATGIINLNSPERNTFDLRLANSELRLHRIFGLFGPGIQYEATSGEDALRAGLIIIPSLGENASLTFRVLPFSFLTQHYGEAENFLDLKLAMYGRFVLVEGLTAETYWKWSMAARGVYGELVLDYRVLDWLSLGAIASHNFSIDGPDSTSVGMRMGLHI